MRQPDLLRVGLGICAFVSACGSPEPHRQTQPLAEYPIASAMSSCAPWDGLATAIFLSEEPLDADAPIGSEVAPPYILISIYDAVTQLAGERFAVDDGRSAGASRCLSAAACESAVSGWVRISETSADRTVVGDFELDFESTGTVVGGFEAQWHERQVMCA